MRFVSIASGSSGNCTYIGSENTHILVDGGVSCKRITGGLETLEIHPRDLSGIFITHEHIDHVRGLPILCKKYGLPLYGSKGTLNALRQSDSKGEIDPQLYHPIVPDHPLQIGDLKIEAFRNTHDAAEPVGYRVEQGEKKVAVVTDLGNYTPYTVGHLQKLDALLIEANHDIRMLQAGAYPYSLKRRILSDYGHLSNETCGKLLCEILHDDMKAILLGHLSQENNFEDLAYETVRCEISAGDIPYQGDDFKITVAKRNTVTPTVEI